MTADTLCPGKELQSRPECSRATINRLILELRLYFSAPIEYDRSRNGYHYAQKNGSRFELPGLWFSPGELLALAAPVLRDGRD